MKKIALVLAVAAFAVPAAQADAAKPKSPTMAQFNALKAQLTKDEKRIKDLEDYAGAITVLAFCQNALVADALQGTWQAFDAQLTALGRPAVFGAQTPVADSNTCSALQISRTHALPPTVAPFSAIAALLGRSAYASVAYR